MSFLLRSARALVAARRCRLAGAAAVFLAAAAGASAEPGIALLRDVATSGEAARAGAAEFDILLVVARLRQEHPDAGLVCVGNRDGAFHAAAEAVLTRVVLMGVPVVKLAQRDPMPVNPDDVFVEGGALPPAVARRLLADCIVRFGPPAAAADPSRPTAREIAATRRKLALYQAVFQAGMAQQVAMH